MCPPLADAPRSVRRRPSPRPTRTALLVALLLPLAASAQPTLDARAPAENRSARALALSAGATAAGVALAAAVHAVDGRGGLDDPAVLVGAAAVALAPSVGNVWLGEGGDAAVGAGLRAAGVGALLYGLSNVSILYGNGDGAGLALIAGASLFTAGVLYEGATQDRNGRGVRVTPSGAGVALRARL